MNYYYIYYHLHGVNSSCYKVRLLNFQRSESGFTLKYSVLTLFVSFSRFPHIRDFASLCHVGFTVKLMFLVELDAKLEAHSSEAHTTHVHGDLDKLSGRTSYAYSFCRTGFWGLEADDLDAFDRTGQMFKKR